MLGIRPCPYCGAEVEMVKLIKRKDEKRQPYRIQCKRCRALVARGEGFPVETLSDAEERIKDYNREIAKLWNPIHSYKINQYEDAQERDWIATNSKMFGPDDEYSEMHDATHRIIE